MAAGRTKACTRCKSPNMPQKPRVLRHFPHAGDLHSMENCVIIAGIVTIQARNLCGTEAAGVQRLCMRPHEKTEKQE